MKKIIVDRLSNTLLVLCIQLMDGINFATLYKKNSIHIHIETHAIEYV